MNIIAQIIPLALFIVVVVVVIGLYDLLRRFVSAQEKMAASLDIIARKLKDQDKQ